MPYKLRTTYKYPKRGDARRDKRNDEVLWSSEHLRLLTTKWPDVGVIAARTGRSRDAVTSKARSLGLPPTREARRPWTLEEDLYVMTCTDAGKWIARVVNRTHRAVWARQQKLRNGTVKSPRVELSYTAP